MYDVIILGLGAMGSAAAQHLAERGKRVLGLEQFGPAHSLGSSHGDSRIIRQAYHEHPNYVPLALRSYELWERLQRDSGNNILRKTGGLLIGPPGSAVVEGAVLSAREHNLAFEILSARDVMRRFPQFRLRRDDTAMYEAVAGFLRPEVAIQAQLQLAEANGAVLRFHEPVEEWTASQSGDSVRVKSKAATYEAAHLVIAPGAWAPQILTEIGVAFDVRRHVMCWFEPTDLPMFQPESCPIYIWDVDGLNCFYGFPATGERENDAKVAMHSGGQQSTANSVDREVSPVDVNELRQYLGSFIPALNGSYKRGSVCLYTLTPDEHFVVCLHPRFSQVSIAAGFSGHGFKFSNVIGEILADLATEQTTKHLISFLASSRFSLE